MERHFLEEFKTLRERLFQMGLMVESSIKKATDALLNRDLELAEEFCPTRTSSTNLRSRLTKRATRFLRWRSQWRLIYGS